MSNFCRVPSGQRISNQTIPVAGDSISIGVWGLDFQGRELNVVANMPGVTCERKALKIPINPINQEWLIKTTVSTRARLEARTQDGEMWDSVDLIFQGLPSPSSPGTSVTPEDKAEVFAAAKSGRILNVTAQLAAVEKTGFYSADGQKKILLADAMFPLLASLARGGVLNVLSLMRFGQGPHGKVIADDAAVCSGVDIGGYAGFTINLTTPEKMVTEPGRVASTISGVAAIVRNLPTGEFAFGFTRPTSHDSGPPQPENDVFLPKKSGEPNYKTWIGNASSQFVNPAAVTQVSDAFAVKANVRVNRMFQDGRDHLHLEVLSSRS